MNKKKLLMFGLPLLAVVLVSAALLAYFGIINQTVNVNQGLTIDGNAWNVPINEPSVTMYSIETKTISSANHQLENTADVGGIVRLDSVCSAILSDNSCEDVVTNTLFELSIPSASPNLVWDRVVTKPGITTVNEINSLTFEYMLTETAIGNSPYFVLELDKDGNGVKDDWAVSWQDTGRVANTWYTHDVSTKFHIVTGEDSCTQQTPCTLGEVKDAVGNANILQIKVAIGEWGDTTATTALVKNIKVNGADAIDNGIIVPASSESTVEGDVDFYIESYFPLGMKPDTYTITTTANLVA